MQQQIKPHYRALSADVRLGLLKVDGTRSYLAVQYWQSRAHWEAATRSTSYSGWWALYEPMLERWEQLMEFDAELQSEELLA